MGRIRRGLNRIGIISAVVFIFFIAATELVSYDYASKGYELKLWPETAEVLFCGVAIWLGCFSLGWIIEGFFSASTSSKKDILTLGVGAVALCLLAASIWSSLPKKKAEKASALKSTQELERNQGPSHMPASFVPDVAKSRAQELIDAMENMTPLEKVAVRMKLEEELKRRAALNSGGATQ